MSTINKKPFIKDLLGSLTEGQISTLSALIDGGGNQTAILRTLNRTETSTRTHITAADKGVKLCNLEFNYSLYNGYLIYNDTYCIFIAFTDSQQLTMFSIDVAGLNLATIPEELSVLELRSELDDTNAAEAAEIVSVVNEAIQNGDIEIPSSTYSEFPETWPTTGTTKAFCDAVNADTNAVVGMAYLGGATFTDLPFNGNGDLVVEILQGPNNGKAIHLILTSGDVAPYHWEYTYWNNGSGLSGWIGNLMAQDIAAPLYNASSDYAVGDLVSHNNKLYECNTPITGGEAWDETHWTATTIAQSILGLINTGI